MDFVNNTHLDSARLEAMIRNAAQKWPLDGLDVVVRYSRRSEFSGTCFYKTGRIYINLGSANRYPFLLRTYIAKAKSDKRRWWREVYTVELHDAYQLVLFVFMHELYHWLVKKARRNTRQKEARCDRFATRALVDGYGLIVRDMEGRLVHRPEWDFQDLDGFVALACHSGPMGNSSHPSKVGAAAAGRAGLPGHVGRTLFPRIIFA